MWLEVVAGGVFAALFQIYRRGGVSLHSMREGEDAGGKVVTDRGIYKATIDLREIVGREFPYPNRWPKIREHIRQRFPEETRPAAWHAVAAQWLARASTGLGGRYVLIDSPSILMRWPADDRSWSTFLSSAQKLLAGVHAELGTGTIAREGPLLIMAFDDSDEYDYHLRQLTHEMSSPHETSALCQSDPPHIALAPMSRTDRQLALVPELVRYALLPLSTPTWVAEGLATIFEAAASGTKHTVAPDTARRCRQYWRNRDLNEFWFGTSFAAFGEHQRASGELAEILVTLISDDAQRFRAFLRDAHRVDGGHEAAFRHLGVKLNDLATGFLCEGNGSERLSSASVNRNR